MLKQVGMLVGIAAAVALGVAVVLWSRAPTYSVLYGSLSDQDVSQIMNVLQSSDIPFKVDHETGAVLVPADEVYQARIKLASEGLPKSASVGFEMLEKEQEFGTSQFLEQARYQRALEGELARSIGTMSHVRSARVHLALPKQSVFMRDKKEPSASVLVDLYPGRVLDKGQVLAITHLVSASVPNLKMSAVTVVDQQGRLLTQPDGDVDIAETVQRFEYSHRLEQSYIERIENILSPLVGPESVKAQVTAELDFTSVEQTSESFNPENTAVRSEQLSEEQKTGGLNGGIPGALSNQPPGEATVPETTGAPPANADPNNPLGANGLPGGANPPGQETQSTQQQPQNTRKQSTRNFEVDKTVSHSRMPLGTVRRLSVAVVVNNKKAVDAAGKESTVARTPAEIEQLTALVKEAVGFNQARGDTVNVINADFTAPPTVEPLPEPPLWKQPWVLDLAKQVLAALVVLYLALGVVRPTMRSYLGLDKRKAEEVLALPGADGLAALPPGSESGEAGDGSTAEGEGQEGEGTDEFFPGWPPPNLEGSTFIEMVRSYVKQEPKLSAQVLKGWLEAS
jgi:flagellar M-ring protein FliF